MEKYAILGAEPGEDVETAVKRLHADLIERDYVIGLEAELAEANRRIGDLENHLRATQRPSLFRRLLRLPGRVIRRLLRAAKGE